MTDKKTEAEHKAPAPKEEPKESKEAKLARLLESYQRNMENNSPRTIEELQILKELMSN
jgi:hypothetical protein